jgi:membrane associated rhomboid family serine protease
MTMVPPNDEQHGKADCGAKRGADEWGLHELSFELTYDEAREKALVLLARGIPCRIAPTQAPTSDVETLGAGWSLRVPEALLDRARAEIALYKKENKNWPEPPFAWPELKVSTLALSLYLIVMSVFFYLQVASLGSSWDLRRLGILSSEKIFVQHEYWRALTALFLHGDFVHLLSNLFAGVLFLAFLVPAYGSGLGTFLALLSGTIGNLVNASFHKEYLSLGASTAIFGMVGLLTTWRLVYGFKQKSSTIWRKLALPLGAGLGFLLLLGSSKQSDYMAHLWGFVAGLAIALPACLGHLPQRLGRKSQIVLSLLTGCAILGSWWLATRGGSSIASLRWSSGPQG